MAVYEIAGVCVDLKLPPAFPRDCIEAYRAGGDCCDALLAVSHEDIRQEQTFQPKADISTLHTSALCRKFSKMLLSSRRGTLIHGAAIIYQGKAYLFVAPSGTGKTTHILLWKKCLKDAVQILNGDKPFLREQNGRIIVYGSPWQGKENLGVNTSCPLGGIYLLNRGQTNTVRPATAHEALQGLLQATPIPEDAVGKGKLLDILETTYCTVPVAILHCTMEDEAVWTVLADIRKGARHED